MTTTAWPDGKVRPPIVIGGTYTFYSTLQGIDGAGIYPCLYTGRKCVVVAEAEDYDREEQGEGMYRVRFEDGAETGVWEGEINGWFFESGQFHGPFAVNRRPGDEPAQYEINLLGGKTSTAPGTQSRKLLIPRRSRS